MTARRTRSEKPAEKPRGVGRRGAAKKAAGDSDEASQELIRAAAKLFADHPPEDEQPVQHREGWIRGRLAAEKKAAAVHYQFRHNEASIDGVRGLQHHRPVYRDAIDSSR